CALRLFSDFLLYFTGYIEAQSPFQLPPQTPSSIDSPSELARTLIPSQSVDKKFENKTGGDADLHDQSSRAVHNQDGGLFVNPHGQGLSATQQGIGHVVPPYQAYVESADDSSGDSQPSGDLDGWLSTSEGDGGLNELSRQTAKPSRSQQSNKSPKRKQNYEGSRDPKRLHVEALDGTEVYLGSRSPQLSGTSELQSAPDQSDQTHGQQSDIEEIGQDFHFVASSGTSPTASCSSQQTSSMASPIEDNPSAESNDGFTDFPADLQAKAQMIGGLATREIEWHFFNYMGSLLITCKHRQQSREKVERLSKKEDGPRKKAKEKLEYWLSLGELLAMPVTTTILQTIKSCLNL
ncbi:hypothetical protein GMDG_07529, partial [Pseudogymnoascus destructans 20631-21]